jgi:hypothetical protein
MGGKTEEKVMANKLLSTLALGKVVVQSRVNQK